MLGKVIMLSYLTFKHSRTYLIFQCVNLLFQHSCATIDFRGAAGDDPHHHARWIVQALRGGRRRRLLHVVHAHFNRRWVFTVI
jgi:hypothetical protein